MVPARDFFTFTLADSWRPFSARPNQELATFCRAGIDDAVIDHLSVAARFQDTQVLHQMKMLRRALHGSANGRSDIAHRHLLVCQRPQDHHPFSVRKRAVDSCLTFGRGP
jgi:hypothetical protein